MQHIYENLSKSVPLGEMTLQRDNLAFITLERAHLRAALQHLRDREGYSHLVLLTAVDWIEEGQFQLTYLVSNRQANKDVGLRVLLAREDARMDSIHDLWPTAATYQRELREMFGIDFPGSPRLNEEFILEGWQEIPPYRRDFDTKVYAEQNFSHREGRVTKDPAQHMKAQLYPAKPEQGGV
ncbi:MAG TPA: NADH-quinone oxidoreductase subunit C [Aliiroseovarius sp.]|nr:NADH-quinone oxidoreductase subunit C [Aliiroseovarius sp.]